MSKGVWLARRAHPEVLLRLLPTLEAGLRGHLRLLLRQLLHLVRHLLWLRLLPLWLLVRGLHLHLRLELHRLRGHLWLLLLLLLLLWLLKCRL